MAQKCENGVFQTAKGSWGYRFSIIVDGRTVTRKKTKDENGKKLTSKKEAIKARAIAITAAQEEIKHAKPVTRQTVAEVFEEYCATGRQDRKYQTIRKQDSLWENHLKERFGKRFVDDITSAEVKDYLAELYYEKGYSFQYTESFLKMFYLIFGQAYSRNNLDVNTYNSLCTNKSTKIKMPKMKVEDDTEIVSFSRDELLSLDNYFRGSNAETAYLLGRYCGLRINETYGLKWDNVDLINGTIVIDRQMQYQEGLIKLVSVKTRNSKRTIYLCPTLKQHLEEKKRLNIENETKHAAVRKQKRSVLEDLDGSEIYSTDLVNCLPDGTIQTVNSMKYHSQKIKNSLGINFKYHFLRHTFGTMMAEMNTPSHLLCNQMGHGNIHVTQKYYLSVSKTGIEILQNNLSKL